MILICMEILLVALAVQAVNTLIYVRSHRALLCSTLGLRQQLTVYNRKQRRPGLKNRDRLFWVLLSRLWSDWRSVLVIVKPDTVIRWQKKRFRDFWRRKSKPGRPCIPRQHISFIRRISGDHPDYGEDRIALELVPGVNYISPSWGGGIVAQHAAARMIPSTRYRNARAISSSSSPSKYALRSSSFVIVESSSPGSSLRDFSFSSSNWEIASAAMTIMKICMSCGSAA